MTWYLVLWLGWSCPGGFLAKLWPGAVKPLVCHSQPERFITANRREARRKVEALGPGARLQRCEGLRCRDERVEWHSLVEFKD